MKEFLLNKYTLMTVAALSGFGIGRWSKKTTTATKATEVAPSTVSEISSPLKENVV